MLSKDIWPVAQFSRLSFDTTCLYVFAENKLISNVKKVSFFFGTPCISTLKTNVTKENVSLDFRLNKIDESRSYQIILCVKILKTYVGY